MKPRKYNKLARVTFSLTRQEMFRATAVIRHQRLALSTFDAWARHALMSYVDDQIQIHNINVKSVPMPALTNAQVHHRRTPAERADHEKFKATQKIQKLERAIKRAK